MFWSSVSLVRMSLSRQPLEQSNETESRETASHVRVALAACGIPLFMSEDDLNSSELYISHECIAIKAAIFSLASPWLESLLNWITSSRFQVQLSLPVSQSDEWSSFSSLHSLLFQSALHSNTERLQIASIRLLCKSLMASIPQASPGLDFGLRVLLTLMYSVNFQAAMIYFNSVHSSQQSYASDSFEELTSVMLDLTQWLSVRYPHMADSFLKLVTHVPQKQNAPSKFVHSSTIKHLYACVSAVLNSEDIAEPARQDIGFLSVGALIRFLTILTSNPLNVQTPLSALVVESLGLSLVHALQLFESGQRELFGHEANRASQASLCLNALKKEVAELLAKIEMLKAKAVQLRQSAADADMRALMYQQVADGIGDMLHTGRLAELSSPQRMVDIIAKQKIEVEILREQVNTYLKRPSTAIRSH